MSLRTTNALSLAAAYAQPKPKAAHRFDSRCPHCNPKLGQPVRMRVPVSALRAGDKLVPTNRYIVRVSRGLRTPSGKHDVDWTREPGGAIQRSTFNSRTIVTVERDPFAR